MNYGAYKRFTARRYVPRQSIFEKLADLFHDVMNINSNGDSEGLMQHFKKFVLVFDIESLLPRIANRDPYDIGGDRHGDVEEDMGIVGPSVKFISRHKPISISMASNIPGYETAHFVGLDGMTAFIDDTVQHMLDAADKALMLNMED